jgi:transcriptional regulator with XRE-family HTH domain
LSNTSLESIQFAKRLASAMESKQIKHSPTSLQRLFNKIFEGKNVTPHTVRNWMLGKTLPTQDKLVSLAKLLGTSSEYLRFGTENGKTFVINNDDGTSNALSNQQKQFVKKYLALNLTQQRLVSDLVGEFLVK